MIDWQDALYNPPVEIDFIEGLIVRLCATV